ncbi:hypothetical protein GCK32_001460 [Trichostrongylus colubriformis]|uniref:Uncharacterized protein n=1 Tax=Trichostrongylus colubriformis TaxID=6319 RepID=A0AAN8F384_TRICO
MPEEEFRPLTGYNFPFARRRSPGRSRYVSINRREPIVKSTWNPVIIRTPRSVASLLTTKLDTKYHGSLLADCPTGCRRRRSLKPPPPYH